MTQKTSENNALDATLVKRRSWWIKWIWVITWIYTIFLIVAIFAINFEVETIYVLKGNVRKVVSSSNNLIQYWSDISELSRWRVYLLVISMYLITILIDILLTRLVYIHFNKYYKAIVKQDKTIFNNWKQDFKKWKLDKKKVKYV